jgi:hypothetical protein
VRELHGGLLSLLERHTALFRVDRIPKSDCVTLISTTGSSSSVSLPTAATNGSHSSGSRSGGLQWFSASPPVQSPLAAAAQHHYQQQQQLQQQRFSMEYDGVSPPPPPQTGSQTGSAPSSAVCSPAWGTPQHNVASCGSGSASSFSGQDAALCDCANPVCPRFHSAG